MFKLLPQNLIPSTRPKILETIYKDNEKIIGNIGGIILNSTNINEGKLLDKVVDGIEKLKKENTDSLIIEELSTLDKEDIELIQKRTNLKIIDGKKILVYFLPIVLNKIYRILGKSLKNVEVLIIGDDEELIKRVIESLHKEIRFITIVGDYEKGIENIYKYILEKTGLSLFYSKNIDKILTNYSIIINLKDNTCIDINNIKKNALIFDLSTKKEFSKDITKNKKTLVIEDFVFQIEVESNWIGNLVYSNIYEKFNEFNPIDLKGLLVNGKVYNIGDFIDYGIRNKGKL